MGFSSICLDVSHTIPGLMAVKLMTLGQTYEGGISGSPGVEAHGAYAYCALACLALLGPPEKTLTRYAKVPCSVIGLSH